MCSISDTRFSGFTWLQEAFRLSDIEPSLAGLFFFPLWLWIQPHFLVYSALQCYQPSSSVCLITFKTAPLPRKTVRDKLSALCRFFSQ